MQRVMEQPQPLLPIAIGDLIKHPKFGTRFVASVRNDVPKFIIVRDEAGDEVEVNRIAGETKITHVNGVPVDDVMRYVPTDYKATFDVPLPKVPLPFKPQEQVPAETGRRKSTVDLTPDVITGALVAALLHRSYKLRVHWPNTIDAEVRELFTKLRVQLPDDIDALEPGKKGGTTIQYGLAGEFVFLTPSDEALLAELTEFSVRDAGNGKSRVSRVGFILALLTAGFKINSYKKRA